MPLTWRNVDAPDFSTSLRGYQVFSDLLGNAFGGLNKSIDQFDTSQTDKVNKAIEAKALQFSDPAAYKQAVSSGALTAGFNPNRIDTSTLNFLDNRGEVLTNRANAAENQQNARVDRQYMLDNRNRTEADRALQDAAEPSLKQVDVLMRQGKIKEADALWETDPTLKALKSSQYVAGVNQGNSLRTGALGLQNAELSAVKGQHDWTNQLQNEERNKAATAIAIEVAGNSGGIDDARTQLLNNKKYQEADPETKAAMIAQTEALFPGKIFGPVGSDAGGIGGTNPAVGNGADVIYGGSTYSGLLPKPPSSMTLSEVTDFGSKLIAATKGKIGQGDKGTSATGTFQLTRDTINDFAPKVLGPNWKNERFSLENQDKISEAVFNSTKGDPAALQARWASLSPSQAAAVSKMPWSQARNYIAQGESGADLRGAQVANLMLAAKNAENKATGLGRYAPEIFSDTSGTQDVVGRLQAGPFKGVPRGFLTEQVNKLVKDSEVDGKATVTPALAGKILENNIKNKGGILGRLIDPLRGQSTPDLAGGIQIDDKGVKADLLAQKNGRSLEHSAIQGQNLAFQSQAVQSAAADAQAKQQKLRAYLEAAKTQPGLAAQVDRLRAESDQANLLLDNLLQNQSKSSEFTPAQGGQNDAELAVNSLLSRYGSSPTILPKRK